MSREFVHDRDARRYILRENDALVAVVDYVVNGTVISFTHTFTNPSLRGRGYAAEIVEFAVNDVEKSGELRILPMCWYVAQWFDRHPERAQLLAPQH